MTGFEDLSEVRTARLVHARARSASLPGRRLLRVLFVPAMLPGMIAIAARGPSPLLWLPLAAIWLAEQLYPARRDWNVSLLGRSAHGLPELLRDAVYLFGIAQLSSLLVGWVDAPVRAAAGSLRELAGLRGALWGGPFALRFALAFLVAELASYWIHRAAHRFGPLWQFHSTHHAVTRLTGLAAVRTHPVDNLLFFAGRLGALVLLGAGPTETVAALEMGALLGLLAHANLELASAPWDLLVNLPRDHAVHHAAEPTAANFGCHTVLWDRLFGTFQAGPAEASALGLPAGPRSLWQELVWPFYRSVSAQEEPPPPGLGASF